MQEKSDFRSFTALWLCLFLFSGLFALLQAVILPPLHLPQGVMFILCSCLSAAPILFYASRTGVWRLYPMIGGQRLPVRVFLYLFSLNFILNIGLSIVLPLLNQVLAMLGISFQQGPPADMPASPAIYLYICLIAPLIEELIYRGVILRKLLPYGTRLAIVLSAVCFGLMHHDLHQGISAMLGGIIYAYVAVRFSLAASVCLHVANNSVSALFPLLKGLGASSELIILVLFLIAILVVLIGSVLVLRRKSFQLPSSVSYPNRPRAVLTHPALWVVLLFDAGMLIILNCIGK